ncbi:hypothetical protein IW261DRAFT_1557119 [Armillaria novae-zelandiae]|uniref:Uncharacterized protein n=1 Tax=Armillaria novae-zelandiae TaxID=153914 RepID=A0AA39TH99_9AGAR|nr:hypothetical protein IW261DRAFT_1557119 [Armillaria novae-zelandiae]
MSSEYYRQSSRAPTRPYSPPLIATERDLYQKIVDEVQETRRFIDNLVSRLFYLEKLVKDYGPPASTYPPPLERRSSYNQRDDVATSYVPPVYVPHSPNPRDPLPERSRYFTDALPESRPGHSQAYRREPVAPEEYRQSFSDRHHLPYTESHHRPRSPSVEPPRRTVYENSPQLRERSWRPQHSPYDERTHRRRRSGGEGHAAPSDSTWGPSRSHAERFQTRDGLRPGEAWLSHNVSTFVPTLMPAPRKRRRSVHEDGRDDENVESWKRPRVESKHAVVDDWRRTVNAGTPSPTPRPESPPLPASPPKMPEVRIDEELERTRADEDGTSVLLPPRQTSPADDLILYRPVSRNVVLPPSLAYKEELRRSRGFPDERPSSSGRTSVRDSPGDLPWILGAEEQ